MDRQKVTFRRDTPVTIRLDRDSSKEVDGHNGPQYMRILDGDTRILFADADLENAIVESGAKKGEVVQIVKRASGWSVGIVTETPRHQRTNGPTYPPARNGHSAAELDRIEGPAEDRAEALRMQQIQANAANHAPAPPAVNSQRGIELIVAGETAVDAAIAITRYAAAKGLALAFTTADIRAMANSIVCRGRE